MTTARDEVLARIRQAKPASAPEVPRAYRTSAPLDLDLFVERLHDYQATVHRCGPDEVTGTVLGLLPYRPLVPYVLDVPGVYDDGFSARELDAFGAVLTGCAVAIAETGTVVLDGSHDQGRRAVSLVPDHHVVIVRADQVVQTVPEALRRLDPTRPQTWISGPSATSDIELQRVEGVHGPRRLDIVLVVP
jgi:L-lactate dehydrogenase complex protein LldG